MITLSQTESDSNNQKIVIIKIEITLTCSALIFPSLHVQVKLVKLSFVTKPTQCKILQKVSHYHFTINITFLPRAIVQWLRLMAHNQEVVGSNPGTIYWMAVNNASYFIKVKNKRI